MAAAPNDVMTIRQQLGRRDPRPGNYLALASNVIMATARTRSALFCGPSRPIGRFITRLITQACHSSAAPPPPDTPQLGERNDINTTNRKRKSRAKVIAGDKLVIRLLHGRDAPITTPVTQTSVYKGPQWS